MSVVLVSSLILVPAWQQSYALPSWFSDTIGLMREALRSALPLPAYRYERILVDVSGYPAYCESVLGIVDPKPPFIDSLGQARRWARAPWEDGARRVLFCPYPDPGRRAETCATRSRGVSFESCETATHDERPT